ncbi:MAG: hypothetical protein L6V93_08300 [Clostridiales bacterium]|nr:MAG: hypothetical protein L6V93_08300 [Clostridiales bacterium]
MPVIYNGSALSSYKSSVFDFSDSRAYLIDNDNDGKIEVVTIWKSTEYYVNSVDTILAKIHDVIGNQLIDLSESSEFDRIRFYDENGEATTFYSIGAGDLLTAYMQ